MNDKAVTLDRRAFLKGTALAGMAVAGATALSACSTTTTNTSDDSDSATNSFEVAPAAITDDKIKETVEADVIIVGAGPSGLVTALSAAEEGLNVVLFAQSGNVVARGGSNAAVYSKKMEELGLEKITPRFMLEQITQAGFNIDVSKWYKWYASSEEAMNWIIDRTANSGLRLNIEQGSVWSDDTYPLYGAEMSHCWNNDTYPVVADGQPSLALELRKQLEALGVRLDFNTQAQELVRGGVANGTKGRVDAVIAEDTQGDYVKYVGTKAVVLATGDFSGDREMMEKYCPEAVEWVQNWNMATDPDVLDKVYGGLYTGQGQKMGLWIGAAWQKTFPNAAMVATFAAPNPNPWNAPTTLMVDDKGERFCNEEMGCGHLPYVMKHVGPVNAIFDSGYPAAHQPWHNWKNVLGEGDQTPEEVLKAWDTALIKSDTLEDLASQLGVDYQGLQSTVDHYNALCEAGNDPDFLKRAELLTPIKTAPFYAWRKTIPTLLTVMGGLRTNIDMQVCGEDDEPIGGLYNVGTMIGDSFGNIYNFLVEGHNHGMNCITFGYLTGKHIAEDE